MKTSIKRIGNSKGIIIPAHLLKQCGLDGEIDIRVEDDSLVISKSERPRHGWEEAFRKAGAGQEEVLLEGASAEFDREEWTW